LFEFFTPTAQQHRPLLLAVDLTGNIRRKLIYNRIFKLVDEAVRVFVQGRGKKSTSFLGITWHHEANIAAN
jgi:hypothetical protein